MLAQVKYQERGAQNFEAGDRYEYEVFRQFKRECITAVRSAGSRGAIDMMGVTKTGITTLVVVKNNGYIPPAERRVLNEIIKKKPKHVQVELRSKRSITVLAPAKR